MIGKVGKVVGWSGGAVSIYDLLSHTVIPKKEANSRRGEALRSLYY